MKKIIIIGAGPAGITAGYELRKKYKDYEVIILETSDAIGGISKTVFHNGNRMDIGGHRFFSKNEEVNNWWNNIMPKQGELSYDDKILNRQVKLVYDGPDPERTDRVMLSRNRVSRIYYNNCFFDYPIKMNKTTIMNMGIFNTFIAGISYLKSCIFKLPETSLENFYINRFGKKLYSMFFEDYTEKLWGRHPREISADWGAQRVKGLSIIAIIKDIINKSFKKEKDNKKVETSLIEEFSYPKYGPGQLWECAASDFIEMGGIIKKNCKVTKIITENNSIKSVGYIENNKYHEIEADYVLSSMPIKDLVEAINNIDNEISKIACGLPYRDFITIGILVNRLILKNNTDLKTLNNIIPDCWIYIQDRKVKLGRLQIFNNWSPYLVEDPVNTVWMGLEYFCSENDDFWNLNDEELIKKGIKELISIGIISNNTVVLDTHCERVKKAYPAYFDTYKDIDKLTHYLDRIENLYCIGRNGQHRYNNMDHSMMTAFEAVKNITENIKDKTNIWNVNTEKEYHETKK